MNSSNIYKYPIFNDTSKERSWFGACLQRDTNPMIFFGSKQHIERYKLCKMTIRTTYKIKYIHVSLNFQVFAQCTQAGVMYNHKLSPHHVDKSCLWTQQILFRPELKFIGFYLIWFVWALNPEGKQFQKFVRLIIVWKKIRKIKFSSTISKIFAEEIWRLLQKMKIFLHFDVLFH